MNILQIIKNPSKRMNQFYRNEKISQSLKKHYAIKKAEAGFHRVKVTELGIVKGYYLLKNLY